MVQPKQTGLSVKEYIDVEQEDNIRYEYYDGKIFSMAGGTRPHNEISGNIFGSLWSNAELRSRNCKPYNSENKIEIKKEERYVYADGFVVCGTPEDSQAITGALLNPIVIFEVVSESSVGYDNGDKFRAYRTLRSLREYVIVDQHQPAIVVYRRDNPQMIFQRIDFVGMDAVLELESIKTGIPFSVIYQSVDFDAAS